MPVGGRIIEVRGAFMPLIGETMRTLTMPEAKGVLRDKWRAGLPADYKPAGDDEPGRIDVAEIIPEEYRDLVLDGGTVFVVVGRVLPVVEGAQ